MMYKCCFCGEVFDEPEHYTESHGFTDGLAESWAGCPNCGVSDYVDYDPDELEFEDTDEEVEED